MTTDNAIRAEAAYHTARHTERANQPRLRHLIVRIVWRPSGVAALVAAVRRATTDDHAVRDLLAAARIPTDLTAGRV